MLKLKQMKKTIDYDSILIANRISMLQNEESKIMKKIENTRKRAEQILEIKKANENRYKTLVQLEQEKEQEIRDKQLQVFKDRHRKKHVSELRSKQRFDVLRDNFSEMKGQRSQIDNVKQIIKQEYQARNMQKKVEVRNEEMENLVKIQKRRDEISQIIQNSYNQRKEKELN